MKQKEVFKKIGGIIKELNDQYEYLQTVTGDLNELELELFIANAHFLTDHIQILAKLNLQNSHKQRPDEKQESIAEEKYFEPVVQQMKQSSESKSADGLLKPAEISALEEQPVPHIDLSPESPEDTYSYIREEPGTIRHELVLDESQNWDEEEEEHIVPENDVSEFIKKRNPHTPAAEASPVSPGAADIKSSGSNHDDDSLGKEKEVLTINQKMSSQLSDKPARTEQLSLQPISDIKQAITLNDKLLYVNDLFNGYSLAYSEAIEILNRFKTFEEATLFLNTNYVLKNNWESKPATTEKFYALLTRRYS